MENRRRFRRREDEDDEEKIRVAKSATEKQRLRLEKLIKNIDKPVVIPTKKDYKPAPPPEFVRNVVGSSAGAGSGEYHIYRNLRKKEFARQQFYEEETKKEKLDKEYEEKIDEKKRLADERTARKRAKRLKKKQNRSKNAKKLKTDGEKQPDTSEESDSETEEQPAVIANDDTNPSESNQQEKSEPEHP